MSSSPNPVLYFDLDGTLSDYFAAARDGLDFAYRRLVVAGYLVRKDRFTALYWERFNRTKDFSDPAARLQRMISLLLDLGITRPELGLVLDRGYQCGRFQRAHPVAGALTVLRQLAPRYRMAVITDGPGMDQRRQLELLRIEHYFERIFISGELGMKKPALGLFSSALEGMQSDPENSVMIGDNPYLDLETPHTLGMKTIFYAGCTNLRWSHQEIAPFVDRIAYTFDTVPALVVQLLQDRRRR